MDLQIAGQTIDRIAFDFAITLTTSSGAELRIETESALSGPELGATCIRPASLEISVLSLLALLHVEIASAVSDDNGRLEVALRNGLKLTTSPNDEFEAWTFADPMGIRIVALPGGGLSSWGPR